MLNFLTCDAFSVRHSLSRRCILRIVCKDVMLDMPYGAVCLYQTNKLNPVFLYILAQYSEYFSNMQKIWIGFWHTFYNFSFSLKCRLRELTKYFRVKLQPFFPLSFRFFVISLYLHYYQLIFVLLTVCNAFFQENMKNKKKT